MQGRRLVASQGTPALGELPEASSLSSLQQAVAVSVAACSAEVMESFDSHLQALGSLEAISSSPVLFASVALENAPLLFALSGVQSPESLQSEYEKLRQTGSALGLALVRGASKMIGTACGKEGHLAAPSSSYLACVSNSLENIAWKAQRALLKQHLNALAYFAEKPDLLPEGPDFSEALRNFTASATKLVQTLRKAAGVSNGALDLRVDRGRISLLLDDALRQFGRTLQDNLLPMGVTFLEDGELSLYGPTIYEKIVSSTSEASRQAPSSGGGGELKSFMIMQRLRGHLNEVIGNESLRRAYTSTANKTGLSSRAVESTFIKSQARHIFIFIQSLLDSRSEDVTTRFSTAEGLHSFIIEFLAEKVAKKEPEEEKSSFGGNVSGEVVALASSVNKEVLRIFAKRISLSSSFQKAKQAAGMNVSTWLKSEFADFRKDIPPSYVIDIAYECLNRCTIPMLADTRLQTQCTDSQGRPQPLGKCADPAAEFQRIISKEMWANFLEDWMTQGKAHSACRELLVLQEEDASAWQRQVFLMYSHLDSIGCGKDHHGYDSFGRYSIKLEMIQNLFEMFASTAKFPTLANFINWLVKLREPLPQDLQTPTALALQYAGGYPQTQVRVSKAFAMAVKGDPSYSQCKPEDTKIISELLGSLGSVFYTLQAFDDFIKERRTGKENITRQVTAPVGKAITLQLISPLSSCTLHFRQIFKARCLFCFLQCIMGWATSFCFAAADARPVLSQLMLTFTATGPRAPDAVIRYPAYVPSSTAALLSQSGAKAMQVFVYIQDVLGNVSATQLTSSDETGHLLDAALATEAWTVKCLGACNSSCTLRSEGEQAISMSISTTAVAPYTFPATDDESLAAAVFGWLLPSFPALRCKAPTRKVIPVVLPIPPPTLPPIPEPSKEVEVPPKPEPEEKPFPPPPPTAPEEIVLPPPEEKVPEIPEAPVVPIPPKQISIKKKKPEIDIKKNENKDATEPEEMITMIPPKTEEAPKLEPKEDACLKVVRLYNKYIQGAEIKDVKTLHEEAMAVPLYRETRKELQIDQKDISMQQFRLALCVTCAKHIPALQLASGEEQQRLAASIEMSKDICASVYKKTLWANEIDGGAPLASATPASLLTKSVQLNLQAAAISHRLLGGAQPLLQAAEKEATAVEVCAAGEVLGRSLQNAKCIILRRNPDISSPFLLALGGLSRAAAKKMPAELSSIFGASVKVAGRRVSPTSLAGGLRNWLSQDMGLAAWAKQAHKKLKSDRSVAALCAALRYAEFIRQISSLGTTFDRMLSHWNLSLPSNGLSLVNALRSASNPKQKLTQELCVLTPPGQEVQRLVQRFDPAYWAALMLQTGEQGEAAAGAAAPAAESARSTEA
ncbi:hypothetical protein, conserved [Eimeria tenella]|uniref:Uncharacterized protein n=1 Tax=Eimeria tenella TaxID=5802 RepID=U6KXH4_EIMTE|nr:hypothetical protein, conserved [Eimeria tenella]CDJ41633.1 hypothetical protein, conserved [Eimeria tenella]|eukprot:XP_013232383.1 hypothetical protein, conserved [Eimeria tenella]